MFETWFFAHYSRRRRARLHRWTLDLDALGAHRVGPRPPCRSVDRERRDVEIRLVVRHRERLDLERVCCLLDSLHVGPSLYFQKFSKAGKLEFEEETLGLEEIMTAQECDE